MTRAGGPTALLASTHLSAHEIAALALDGLPETKRGIQLLAERQGWSTRQATGRGGVRVLYAVADLPSDAQRDLVDRWVSQPSTRPQAKVGRPKGSDYFSRREEVAAAVEAWIAERPLSSARVMELLQTRFNDLPSPRSLRRFIAHLEATKPALLASTRDPDLFKSRYRLALGQADAVVSHAHQVWEIDTTMADVMTKGGRVAILGIIDVWSRRAKYLVVPSESAQSVRRTLVATIKAWGVVPERLRTDNGSGYINQTILSAAPLLGIEVEPCPPGSPEKKPFVERLFGTFTRERASLLAGFAGHSVADAQRLRAAAKKRTGRAVIVPEMTPDDLQVVIDNWIDGVYNLRVHSGTDAAPIARFLASPVPARAAPDADTLKLALSAYVGTARVGKRGVQWKKGRYWSAPLAGWVGRDVMIRRDEDDLGELFVFDGDGRFICTAVNHERSGLSQEAFAREARRHQQDWMTAERSTLRDKSRQFSFEQARDDLLRRDAEQAGKLVTLPVQAQPHTTPMIDSVKDVVELPSDEAIADAAARLATPRTTAPTSFAERAAEADRLIAADAAGEAVDPDALRRARIFASSTEYRANKILSGNFARPAPAPSLGNKEARL